MLGAGLTALAATLSISPAAQADVSSWAYAGGGASTFERHGGARGTQGLVQLETGIGLSPEYPVAVGALFRSMTHLGEGTDWALMARAATSGFSNGDLGLALDVGAYQRWWGQTSTGLLATLGGGLPWGVNISATGGYARPGEYMVGLTVGIDWARLTSHRSTGGQWLPNYRLPVRADNL